MAIKKNKFWGENFYKNPILTAKMIVKAESALNVQLPNLLIELLQIQNGGYTKGFAFPMTQKTTWADNHVPLNELFGIVIDEAEHSGPSILDSDYLIKEWDLPSNQVILTGDGHWYITLDYRISIIPTVRWIDIECNEDIHISDSFENFIGQLMPEDDFA